MVQGFWCFSAFSDLQRLTDVPSWVPGSLMRFSCDWVVIPDYFSGFALATELLKVGNPPFTGLSPVLSTLSKPSECLKHF
jgi:hypothetical protein